VPSSVCTVCTFFFAHGYLSQVSIRGFRTYFACQYYAARGCCWISHTCTATGRNNAQVDDRQKVRTGGSGDSPFVEDGEDCGNVKREDISMKERARRGQEPPRKIPQTCTRRIPACGYWWADFCEVNTLEPGSRPPGMLLQELVSTLLKPTVPPGWERLLGEFQVTRVLARKLKEPKKPKVMNQRMKRLERV
jgi:hypothetical protein